MSVFEGINYFCHDMLMLAPAIVVNKYILFYSNLEKLSFQKYSFPSTINITRRHPDKMFKLIAVNRSRANFCSVWSVFNWNSLPEI